MELDVRTILVLHDPAGERVLLLRRSPHKKLFPNLITGIGGKVELEDGEAEDIERSLWREVSEETGLGPDHIKNLKLRLTTILSRDQQQVVLFWFTGSLMFSPDEELACEEGQLQWFARDALPVNEMTPTGREAIPLVVSLMEDQTSAYNGIYDPVTLRLTTNRPRS